MKKVYLLISTLFIWNNLFAQYCYDSANVYSFEYNGIKYEIVKENKKWIDAAECAYVMGGILTEINSQEEQDTIFHHLQNAGIDPADNISPDGGNASYIWIGGNDMNEEGKWVWDGSNDGIGNQFWQGTKTGSVVNELFNNWGNEPDNFGDQDGLGLAITNWPFGKAGQWNDISIDNELYFIIEYDYSTVKISDVNYSYDIHSVIITTSFNFDFDSVQVYINDTPTTTIFNVSKDDTILVSKYNVSETTSAAARIYAYRIDKIATSKELPFEIFVMNNPVNSYITDFEDNPPDDFLGDAFSIRREFGFRNNAIHSIHDYENDNDYTYTLTKPIILSQTDAVMMYSDVAIVEPGMEGSQFGGNEFNDYVVVEGSKVLGEWIPLADGYDVRLHPEWETAWTAGGPYRTLYKSHNINLTDTFNPGDTILIRFRLHSNSAVTGWGWAIDSLQIQDFALNIEETSKSINTFSLQQNYPNPFNPATTISFDLPEQTFVTLKVFDMLGKEIKTIVNKDLSPGNHKYNFDASKGSIHIASGIYIYRISAGKFTDSRKLLLLK